MVKIRWLIPSPSCLPSMPSSHTRTVTPNPSSSFTIHIPEAEVSSTASNLLDALCTQLETFVKYDEGERDLVMQVYRGVARWRGANNHADA
ncbi:hypothetical protein AX14_004964 [Amanita brunnescens Koide BX004]|nr:hypothetical protein AX14_004964 [Amanita brunnescens Koide BX004]